MAITSLFKRKKKGTTKKVVDKKVAAAEVVAQPSHKAPAVAKALAGLPTGQASKPAGRRVMLTPLVSEKGVDRQTLNQVVFRVSWAATKGQIAQAVTEQYGVRPIKVRTIRMHPKRRRRGRSEGFTTQWKKAYVSVADLKPFNVTP